MPDDVFVITTMGTSLKICKKTEWKAREQSAALIIKVFIWGC